MRICTCFLNTLFVSLMMLPGYLLASEAQADIKFPRIASISTSSPRQIVKEATASPYLFQLENDLDRDGQNEIVVGANCEEGFCVNFIFRQLHNNRVQYLGHASFNHQRYELVWGENTQTLADIVYFKQENVGQGCLGRYHYVEGMGYRKTVEVCRLPKQVMEALSSYTTVTPPVPPPPVGGRNLDAIDLSDIEFNDDPADLYPDPAILLGPAEPE